MASHSFDSALSSGSAAKEESTQIRGSRLRYRFEPIAVKTAGSYGGTTGAFLGCRNSDVANDLRETFF